MWLPDPTDQHFESKYISVGARCNVKAGMTRLTAEPFSREHTGRGTAQGARQNQSLSGEPKLSGGRSTKQHMTDPMVGSDWRHCRREKTCDQPDQYIGALVGVYCQRMD